MELAPVGEASNLAFVKMLTHTKSLQSLSLVCTDGLLADTAVVAAASGLKKNSSLRELTLHFPRDATDITPTLTSLSDHPLLRRLCLHFRGDAVNLTGLDTVLLSDNSKISELQIDRVHAHVHRGPSIIRVDTCFKSFGTPSHADQADNMPLSIWSRRGEAAPVVVV
jgi:hypothetical protein